MVLLPQTINYFAWPHIGMKKLMEPLAVGQSHLQLECSL